MSSILRAPVFPVRARSLTAARRVFVPFASSNFRFRKHEPHASRSCLAKFRARTLPNLLPPVSLINVPAPQRNLWTPVESKSGLGRGKTALKDAESPRRAAAHGRVAR
jgi:hypothetical protein